MRIARKSSITLAEWKRLSANGSTRGYPTDDTAEIVTRNNGLVPVNVVPKIDPAALAEFVECRQDVFELLAELDA